MLRNIFVITCLLWCCLIFACLVTYSNENPIKTRFASFQILQNILPQGWAFFTKNAREAPIEVYQYSNSRVIIHPEHRQASLTNLLGFKRNARSMSVEFSYLMDKIENVKWSKYPQGKIIIHKPFFDVDNLNKTPILNDTILLMKTNPIPWAWSKNRTRVKYPYEIIRLNIRCKYPPKLIQ